MTMNLITGLIGIALLVGFLGIMMWWIKAVPIILICLIAVGLLVEDFVAELKRTNGASKG